MKKVLSVLGGFICLIICFVLFGVQILFITYTSARTLITKDSIKEVLNDVDIREAIQISNTETSDLYGAFDSMGFSVEETNAILESDSFKEFINEYIYNNIVENILEDEDIKLEKEAIYKLVDDIENEKNIKFENKDKFLKLVDDNYEEISSSINISNTVKDKLDEKQLEVIRKALNGGIIIGFSILFVIIFLLMCLFRWSLYKPIIWYGITTIISSITMLQAFIGINRVKTYIEVNEQVIEKMSDPVLKVVKSKGILISSIALALGILLVVIFAFVNKRMKEYEKNEESEFLEKGEETL